MLTEAFDFHLPAERIAQAPLAEREAARLLLVDRGARAWQDRGVRDLPNLLRPGDLLVFNDTRVVPARLRATRENTGGAVEIFLLPPETDAAPPDPAGPTVRRVLTKSGGRLQPGEALVLPEGVRARLLERLGEAGDKVAFELPPADFLLFVQAHGEVPLPPYIRRPAGPSSAEDRERYQTVFAREAGAVAAPTAGLHFSAELLAELDRRGVERTAITLHVGPGTFKPVKAERAEDHRVDPEPYRIGAEAARAVTRAKAEGRRVIPVGTTAMRTLEACWDAERRELRAGAGYADLFIRPPYEFRVAGALLTNFHLPKSSLLMLVAAFASPGSDEGIAFVKAAYAHAVEAEYRFFSYGDACLIV
ncbi:MAG: tRNA preQ1(34) S-adenosylmethionine ribosyltransferase-isomerase QueA [Planctomycetota bacterium]|nr:tRNA preQ1(34) S-adenosylmethionine ribosyltransferase-isomerase QueA [Planctomycetota bacterium]